LPERGFVGPGPGDPETRFVSLRQYVRKRSDDSVVPLVALESSDRRNEIRIPSHVGRRRPRQVAAVGDHHEALEWHA
jgi:hypothetical protein